MKKERTLIIVLLFFPWLVGLLWITWNDKRGQSQVGTPPTYSLVINNKNITVEIAATEADRNKGLMYRTELPEDYGMLFVYPQAQPLSFWMKNTYLPLSIAFIKDNGLITEIRQMEPLSEDTITSTDPVRYALEMPQGWFKRNNIKTGDSIQIPSGIGLTKTDKPHR